MRSRTLQIKETRDGDAYFILPNDLLDSLGWIEGDDLEFLDDRDGVFIRKLEKKDLTQTEFNLLS